MVLMNNNPTILILGGSSFVGKYLYKALGPKNSVATFNHRPFPGGIRFDAVSMSVNEILEQNTNVSCAVLLLGETNPDRCIDNAAESQLLNVDGIKAIITELTSHGIRILFTSSEFVFDGISGNYDESAKPNSILTYGQQKVDIEQYLQANCPGSVIVRLSKVVGSEPGDGTLFASWLYELAQLPTTIRCASDQIFSAVHVDDVVAGIMVLLSMQVGGIFHVAGPQGHSRMNLLRMLVAELQRYRKVEVDIRSCSIHDFQLKERRPLNVSLNPQKLMQIANWKPRPMTEVCRRIVKVWCEMNVIRKKLGT